MLQNNNNVTKMRQGKEDLCNDGMHKGRKKVICATNLLVRTEDRKHTLVLRKTDDFHQYAPRLYQPFSTIRHCLLNHLFATTGVLRANVLQPRPELQSVNGHIGKNLRFLRHP